MDEGEASEDTGLAERLHGGNLLAVFTIVAASAATTLRDVWVRPEIPLWVQLGLTLAFAVLAFSSVLESLATKSAKRRASEAHTDRIRRGLLLKELSRHVGTVLSEIRKRLVGIPPDSLTSQLQECMKAILRGLCSVFENDPSARSDVTFFKATIFEYDASIGTRGGLTRKYWHYPPTKNPGVMEFDLDEDRNSAAVKCLEERRMQVLEDVNEEMKQGTRWREMRPEQNKDYSGHSMICVPIWGEEQPNTVRGVLTVDTNRARYFRSGSSEEEFLSQLLEPFIDAARLAYVLAEVVESNKGVPGASASDGVPTGPGDPA